MTPFLYCVIFEVRHVSVLHPIIFLSQPFWISSCILMTCDPLLLFLRNKFTDFNFRFKCIFMIGYFSYAPFETHQFLVIASLLCGLIFYACASKHQFSLRRLRARHVKLHYLFPPIFISGCCHLLICSFQMLICI